MFEQCCDKNIEQYYNDPIFDKPTSDEIEDGSEENETLTLMILDTLFTPKQDGEEVIEKDDEESYADDHTLGLCPKVQEVVCEAPPTIEDLIESKFEDMIKLKIEECFQDLPSKMPLVQYTKFVVH